MAKHVGRPAEHEDAVERERLTPAEFAVRFQSVRQALWYIAAAVVGDRAGADDVLQEAAVIALEKLRQFDPQTNFTAWMARIVRFVGLNHGRRRQKLAAGRREATPLEELAVTITPRANSLLNGHGQLLDHQHAFDDRVTAALACLEETARACLLLRTIMNMPYREIASALDLAEGTAMSHVHRARMALREKLASDYVDRNLSDPTPQRREHAQ